MAPGSRLALSGEKVGRRESSVQETSRLSTFRMTSVRKRPGKWSDPMADDETVEEVETEDSATLKEVREANKRLEKKLAQYERQAAFTAAEVDLDSEMGKFFAEHYTGKLDPTVIKAEAEKLGVLKTAEVPEPETPQITEEETQQTAERQALATGASPDAGITEDPHAHAKRVADQARAEGATEDRVLATQFAAKVAAGNAGDRRVYVQKPQ